MALIGSKINDTKLKNILNELNIWCMNYRGFVNQVFSEQVTTEEKITKLFWCIKEVLDSQINVVDGYNELYDFVNNYFENLDLQEEVNKKIDEMVSDGTFDGIINEKILNDVLGINCLHLEFTEGNKKVLFMGDSIANGYGWWDDDTPKTNANDGVCAIWRKKYPNNTFENIAVNQTTLCGNIPSVPYISQQLAQISSNDYTHIFIICGINDISAGANNNIFKYFGDGNLYFQNEISNDFSTSLSGLASTFTSLRSKVPNAKIYYIIPPTCSTNIEAYNELNKMLMNVAHMYGVYIINAFAMFYNYNLTYQKKYLHDRIHPNENGYRKLADFIIQGDFQKNQITLSDTKILFVDDLNFARTDSVETILKELKSFTLVLNEKLGNTYYVNRFLLFSKNHVGRIFVEVSRAYKEATYFKYLLGNMNGLEICFVYNDYAKNVFLYRVGEYTQRFTPTATSLKSLDEIECTSCMVMDPKSDNRLITAGFSTSPYVYVNASVSYNTNKDGGYNKCMNAIITQPGKDFICVYTSYNYADSSDVKKLLKINGSIVE